MEKLFSITLFPEYALIEYEGKIRELPDIDYVEEFYQRNVGDIFDDGNDYTIRIWQEDGEWLAEVYTNDAEYDANVKFGEGFLDFLIQIQNEDIW